MALGTGLLPYVIDMKVSGARDATCRACWEVIVERLDDVDSAVAYARIQQHVATHHVPAQVFAEPMTDAEHRAMDLTAELVNLMCSEVIGHGAARDGDVAELVADIHRIQHRILRQAAGRAYPDRYRMLGGDPPAPAVQVPPQVDPNLRRGWRCGSCNVVATTALEVLHELVPNEQTGRGLPTASLLASHLVDGDSHLLHRVIIDGERIVVEDSPEGQKLFAKLLPWMQARP